MLDASLTPHTHTHKIASSRFMGKILGIKGTAEATEEDT